MFSRVVHLVRYALPALILASLIRPRRPIPPLPGSSRILVTRLDGIGDFILLAPFLRELRRNYPNSIITLIVGRNAAPLARPCPYVNEVLMVDLSPTRAAFSSYSKYLRAVVRHVEGLVKLANRQLAGRIDLAIQPRWDTDVQWATLITFLSGARRTVGYSEKTSQWKSWSNFGYDRLFKDVLPPGIEQHEAERNLDIIRYLGGSVESTAPEIWWRQEDQRRADDFMTASGLLGAENVIAFGIGAAKEWCRWPFYGQLIRLLGQNLTCTPLLLAGPGEEKLVREITALSDGAVVMREMPLGVVAAALSRCTLFVGNNSGPLHLASAVGLPVIEICAHPMTGELGHEGHPDRFGSLASPKVVIRPVDFSGHCKQGCSATTPHCITTIRPEEVASQVMQLLASIKTPA
jgi:ADP-heptose:LPS heptosyltransferase